MSWYEATSRTAPATRAPTPVTVRAAVSAVLTAALVLALFVVVAAGISGAAGAVARTRGPVSPHPASGQTLPL